MNTKTIYIYGEYITLGQLIKKIGLVEKGGDEKSFLQSHSIFFGGVEEKRRGKKLHIGESITIDSITYTICSSKN